MKHRVTNFETGNPLTVSTVDLSPDGLRLVVGQQADPETGLALGLWSLETRALERALVNDPDAVSLAARFSPDGRLLAFSDANQDLVIHDVATGASDRNRVRMSFAKWLTFAQNRNRLIVGGPRTKVWDPEFGAAVFTLPVPALLEQRDITPPCCALSPDGDRVAASGVERGGIAIYDVARGVIASRIESTMLDARSMAFDPSGRLLAATARKGGAGLWNVETGEALLPDLLNMQADYYWCVSFHPDGAHVGFGLWSGFVDVIRIADGDYAVSQDAPVHLGRVNDLAFSRDGTRMVTGGDDGAVLVWELG